MSLDHNSLKMIFVHLFGIQWINSNFVWNSPQLQHIDLLTQLWIFFLLISFCRLFFIPQKMPKPGHRENSNHFNRQLKKVFCVTKYDTFCEAAFFSHQVLLWGVPCFLFGLLFFCISVPRASVNSDSVDVLCEKFPLIAWFPHLGVKQHRTWARILIVTTDTALLFLC